MAAATSHVRATAVAKTFWLRKGLAARLARIVEQRRASDAAFTERRALEVAIRAYVEKEEQALGLAGAASPGELVEQIAEAAAQLRGRVGGGGA